MPDQLISLQKALKLIAQAEAEVAKLQDEYRQKKEWAYVQAYDHKGAGLRHAKLILHSLSREVTP
jgi:hypothetical protein